MGEASTLAQESPKLLTLDKADVRAIRSFLPGKVLGRTAALLALVVLVLGFATSVDVGLERFLGFPARTTHGSSRRSYSESRSLSSARKSSRNGEPSGAADGPRPWP